MKQHVVLWILLLLLLASCGQEAAQPTALATAVTEPGPTSTPQATETPAPTVAVRQTVTVEPTPWVPAISVKAQTLTEAGTVMVESITSAEPGWVAIYADDAGAPGALLGFEAVEAQANRPVEVAVDSLAATATLYARLHLDAGNQDEFEYPGPDVPLQIGSREVIQSFDVDVDVPRPEITIADQTVGADGIVTVDSVFALEPGWLVIHWSDGTIGEAIGQAPVEAGENNQLEVPIRWQEATAELTAVLHEDNERPGGFDAANDLPALSGGAPVTARFEVQLPPDIFVYDQPIAAGKLSVERIISENPGWIVVYTDNEGQPDVIIGFEKVNSGINPLVDIDIIETAITPQLLLVIHDETDNPAEFNFPVADPAATYDGQPIPPTGVLTSPGNYLITRDQSLGEKNEVVIPLVVADLDTWVVIYSQTEDGRPDEILGQAWLPAGINREVPVSVRSGLGNETLLAVLHQDAGTPLEFDYPDGDDVPLQRNRQIIFSPFLLREGSAANSFNP